MLLMDVCSHVVWKGGEQWWPRVESGLKVWRWQGCQSRGTVPFLLQLLRQASEGLFLHSLCASPGSFSAECFEVVLFLCSPFCVLTAAPLQQRPSPLAAHNVCCSPKEQESCCSPVGVFGDELSQYHSANTWLSDANNCFLFREHIYEHCISVYFST